MLILLFLFLKVPGTRNSDRSLPLREKLKRLDPVGCLLFVGAITCLLLALQWGGQKYDWRSAMILGLFCGAIALLVLFGYTQTKRGEHTTIPLRVLRKRSIWTGSVVLFLLGATTSVASKN